MTNTVFYEHRMVGNDFNPASVIWCHNSTGAVAYVGIRVLLKVNMSNCTEKDPAYSAINGRVSLNTLE
jgi:predicted phosphoadenosine phosphosulfate sulfurtransferase